MLSKTVGKIPGLLQNCAITLPHITTSFRLPTRPYSIIKIKIDDLKIHYQKIGTGSHVVLCCPGFAGSVQESILPFVKKMNLEEFTFIAWDPPGYGRSRPPDRNVEKEEFVLISDGKIAGKLMQELGYEKYSIIGHSQGGVTGAILAGLQPETVQKLVMCNSPLSMNTRTLKVIEMMRELETWTPQQRASLRRVYEKDYFVKLCNDWWKVVEKESKENLMAPILKDIFKKVQAPVMYIQGQKDLLVPLDDGKNYMRIFKKAKLLRVHEGGHDHIEFLQDFVTLSRRFLLE